MKKIALYGKYGEGKFALVDDEDYGWLSEWIWRCVIAGNSRKEYVKATIDGEQVLMHRLILGTTDPAVWTDHKDGNGLNNQRSNLRPCTPSQNGANTPAASKSGYRGVTWSSKVGKWIAYVVVMGKTIPLGKFDSRHDAALAYNIAAIEHHGEFARLNEVPLNI